MIAQSRLLLEPYPTPMETPQTEEREAAHEEPLFDENDYLAVAQQALEWQKQHEERRSQAAVLCKDILSNLDEIANYDPFKDGGERADQRTVTHISQPTNLKALFLGIGTLFLQNPADKIVNLNRILNESKEVWEGIPLYDFFNRFYQYQVNGLFAETKVLIAKKEKSLRVNYYTKCALTSTALTTACTIAFQTKLVFQAAALIASVACLIFMIYKSGQDSFELARGAASLKFRISEAERATEQNLLSIQALTNIFDT
ncbi:MAG: hypothetical protein LW832_05115 [Parachlamydia sp.]|jgi:hypothetical protein|nr:hypothetical protein [Parachlamydia sp.]